MLTYTATLLALVATVANAAGSIDNSADQSKVSGGSSALSGDGNYVFTNKATGQTLSFVRQGSLTNFFPQDGTGSVAVQFNGNQARLSGGNNKCVSAQWSFDEGNDLFAVPYACAVGSGPLTGSATLEKTKQWWYFYPADGGSSSSAAPAASPAAASSSKKGTVAAAVVQQNTVKTKASTKAATVAVNSKDRTTWVCKHDGAWLVAHPEYVTKGGHVECADELAAAQRQRLVKRTKKVDALEKRGGGQAYYIIAVDHLNDMTTRAIGNAATTSFGGYTSTTLPVWNEGDETQMWYITQA